MGSNQNFDTWHFTLTLVTTSHPFEYSCTDHLNSYHNFGIHSDNYRALDTVTLANISCTNSVETVYPLAAETAGPISLTNSNADFKSPLIYPIA